MVRKDNLERNSTEIFHLVCFFQVGVLNNRKRILLSNRSHAGEKPR